MIINTGFTNNNGTASSVNGTKIYHGIDQLGIITPPAEGSLISFNDIYNMMEDNSILETTIWNEWHNFEGLSLSGLVSNLRIHKYSSEYIYITILDPITNVTYKKSLAWPSTTFTDWSSDMNINDNLLINPNFKINQRGQSEYICNTQIVTYILDMWKLVGTVEVFEDYITISPENSAYGYASFSQIIPIDNEGKCFTISAQINDEIVSASGICSTEYIGYIGDGFNLRFVSINSEQIGVDIIADEKIKVNWVKLELDRVATTFVPPDPATELVKCQRYYQCIKVTEATVRSNLTTTYIDVNRMLNIPMRVNPTIKVKTEDIGNSISLVDNNIIVSNGNVKQLVPIDLGFTVAFTDFINISFTCPDNMLVTDAFYIFCICELSAEL